MTVVGVGLVLGSLVLCIMIDAFASLRLCIVSIACSLASEPTDRSSIVAGLLLAQCHSYSILVHTTNTVSRCRHEMYILQLTLRYCYCRRLIIVLMMFLLACESVTTLFEIPSRCSKALRS